MCRSDGSSHDRQLHAVMCGELCRLFLNVVGNVESALMCNLQGMLVNMLIPVITVA